MKNTFTFHRGRAVPLDRDNIDTDQVMELFDFVFESSKENVRKPDPDFYLRACERGNVDPTDVVFLDDLGINLKPARELGMKTIKVIQPIDALSELNAYLDINID